MDFDGDWHVWGACPTRKLARNLANECPFGVKRRVTKFIPEVTNLDVEWDNQLSPCDDPDLGDVLEKAFQKAVASEKNKHTRLTILANKRRNAINRIVQKVEFKVGDYVQCCGEGETEFVIDTLILGASAFLYRLDDNRPWGWKNLNELELLPERGE